MGVSEQNRIGAELVKRLRAKKLGKDGVFRQPFKVQREAADYITELDAVAEQYNGTMQDRNERIAELEAALFKARRMLAVQPHPLTAAAADDKRFALAEIDRALTSIANEGKTE